MSNKLKDKYNSNYGILFILGFDNLTKNLIFFSQVSANIDNEINVYGFWKDESMLRDDILNGRIVEKENFLKLYKATCYDIQCWGTCTLWHYWRFVCVLDVILIFFVSDLVINSYNDLIFDKDTSPKKSCNISSKIIEQ